jgi:hypothetical protein
MLKITTAFFNFQKRYKYYTKILFLVALLTTCKTIRAQTMNFASYDSTKFHFGFLFAINVTNFTLQPTPNLASYFNDTLKGIYSHPKTGFNIGIVTEYKIGKHFKLHFAPDLSFAERDIAYSFIGKVDTFTVTKRIESTFLDFPLDIKVISKRFGNFQFFALAGLKYTYDFASQGNQQVTGIDGTLRLMKNDMAYEGGGGLKIFMKHFKLGIELKYSQGIDNLLINDNSIYTQSIKSLKSNVFLVSFNIGG